MNPLLFWTMIVSLLYAGAGRCNPERTESAGRRGCCSKLCRKRECSCNRADAGSSCGSGGPAVATVRKQHAPQAACRASGIEDGQCAWRAPEHSSGARAIRFGNHLHLIVGRSLFLDSPEQAAPDLREQSRGAGCDDRQPVRGSDHGQVSPAPAAWCCGAIAGQTKMFTVLADVDVERVARVAVRGAARRPRRGRSAAGQGFT